MNKIKSPSLDKRGLESSRPILDALFSLDGIPIAVADMEGHYIDCNDVFADLMGYSPDEIANKTIFDLTHPDEIDFSKEKIQRIVRGETLSYRIEKRYMRKDGSRLWVDVSVSSILDKKGKPIALIGIFKDITQQKEMDFEVKKQATLLESILNSIPDLIGIQDPDHGIIRYNEAGYEFLNIEPEDVKEKKCYEIVGREVPCDVCATSKVYKTKKSESVERYEESMGLWLDVRAYPVLDEKNEIDYVVEHVRDITDVKRNEFELQHTRQMYMDTLNNLNDSVLVVNKDLKIELVNDSYRKLLKRAGIDEDPLGRNIFDLQPFLPEKVMQEYRDVFESGEILATDEQTRIGDREFNTYTIKIPIKKGERVDKIITVIRDTTDQMYYLNELRAGEERVKNILESSPDSITITDLDGKVIDCNEATLILHGFDSKEEIIGRNALEFIHKKDHERAMVNMTRVLAEERLDNLEYELIRKNGTSFPGRMSASLMRDGDGKPQAFIGISSDITDRKRSEKILQRRLQFEYLISNISSDFINTSPEKIDTSIEKALELAGDFVKADRAYVFLYRDNNRIMDNTHEWYREGISSEKENLQDLNTEDFYIVRDFLLRDKMIYLPNLNHLPKEAEKDREEFEREGIRALLNAPLVCDGRIIGFVGFDSVKNEVKWERETIDFLRLVGQIIATTLVRYRSQTEIIKERERAEFYLDLMGHDIGNLHQGIYSGLQIARHSNDRKIRDMSLNSTEDLVKRSIKLVKNVLLLSKLGIKEPDMEKIDVKDALKNALEQVEKLFPSKELSIETKMSKGKVMVMAEPIIEEVFLNLLHNGVKFQDVKKPKLEVSLKKRKDHAEIVISDYGMGMPQKSKALLFSRFSPQGKGSQTGIGLSLVKALTDRYNGSIEVLNRVEGDYRRGTKFILRYPLA